MTKKITSVQYFILRQAFTHMIDDLDTARMATAINVLRSGRGLYVTPDKLEKDIHDSYMKSSAAGDPRKATDPWTLTSRRP